MCIEKERTSNTPPDDLIAYLSSRELTGYDAYDGYYDGYPTVDEFATTGGTGHSKHPSVLDIGEDHFDSRVYALKSWHRIIHDNLHPKQVQSYLAAWAPLRVIQKTLEVTTQLAKMAIRHLLRRHMRSRLSHMRAQRLDEVVSTDPMFANSRCFGPGWTGGQVYYVLKSTKIRKWTSSDLEEKESFHGLIAIIHT